jgi:hypothetical protein
LKLPSSVIWFLAQVGILSFAARQELTREWWAVAKPNKQRL